VNKICLENLYPVRSLALIFRLKIAKAAKAASP